MKRRKFLGAFVSGLVLGPSTTLAQRASTAPRIGFLGSESAANQGNRLEAFKAGLRDLGYVEGRNIVIEVRWAEGHYDRLPGLAAELVNPPVSVIVASGAKATRAARQATKTIPIVVETGDAVALGVVGNLARPGGNITGWTFFGPDLTAKRLELLKEASPRISQVAFLFNPADPPSTLPALQTAANALKVSLRQFEARGPSDLEGAFTALVQNRCEAVIVQADTMFEVNGRAIADLATRHRLLSAGNVGFAESGGLIGNGADLLEGHRRLAVFVDAILRGANAGDLPIQQATKFELVINARTAAAIGLGLPRPLVLRADRVIE